jgi:putative ATP-dependent endonuclease of OLD family
LPTKPREEISLELRRVLIENFRGIRKLELELDETTVIIGENNSGKTAVLEALRLCLRDLGPKRRVVFDTFDFHLKDATTDPSSAEPIRVELEFSEKTQGQWSGDLVGRLNRQKILQVDAEGRSHVVLHVSCKYDAVAKDYDQDWDFRNLKGQALTGVSDMALGVLQREVAYFYLAALREAARHFDAKGPFWRPFLKDSQLPAAKKEEIERKLKELNDLVVSSHTSFEQARDRLQKVQNVVPMASGDVVAIEAVPGRMFDMLSKAQIHLGTATGAKVPVGRHGEGTQSLAVLMLFSAFLDAWPAGSPIIALEEPEAHLHPSAVRALWRIVAKMTGQRLVSTHSGDLLSEVDVQHIRRLARTAKDGVTGFRVLPTLLSAEEERKFKYHVRHSRGELLFARCWLLVEGESEVWVYSAAARAMGLDLHRDGIRLVEYSQSDVALLTKVANALGIPWYCVIDDDSGRTKYEAAAKANLGTLPQSDRIAFPYTNIEIHLLGKGYDGIYRQFMPGQNLAKIKSQVGDASYWPEYAENLPGRAKTRAASATAAEMEKRGDAGITDEIRAVLKKAASIAGPA